MIWEYFTLPRSTVFTYCSLLISDNLFSCRFTNGWIDAEWMISSNALKSTVSNLDWFFSRLFRTAAWMRKYIWKRKCHKKMGKFHVTTIIRIEETLFSTKKELWYCVTFCGIYNIYRTTRILSMTFTTWTSLQWIWSKVKGKGRSNHWILIWHLKWRAPNIRQSSKQGPIKS